MTLTTPALLFPAISLLLLAYTNRYLVIARLIRDLHAAGREEIILRQIKALRLRIQLIKWMQVFGVGSFLVCTVAMLFLYLNLTLLGELLFGASLLVLVLSLMVSLWEVYISTNAINIELEDIEN